MIEPSSIENLKAIIDISDVISSYIPLKNQVELCVRMSISQ
ncbi:hypothetical protein [Campylobacter devanensis]|nr:hypothetical protein [Campylobacter sp. P0187]